MFMKEHDETKHVGRPVAQRPGREKTSTYW
jgi:hypothetical protein